MLIVFIDDLNNLAGSNPVRFSIKTFFMQKTLGEKRCGLRWLGVPLQAEITAVGVRSLAQIFSLDLVSFCPAGILSVGFF